MSEDPSAKKPSFAATWGLVVALALVGYLLFPGILAGILVRNGLMLPPAIEKPFTMMYSPVNVLEKNWGDFGEFYAWYINTCAGQEIYIPLGRSPHTVP